MKKTTLGSPRVFTRPPPPETSRTSGSPKEKRAGNNPPPPPLPLRGGEGRGVLPRDAVEGIVEQARSLTRDELRQLLAKLSLLATEQVGRSDRDLDMWAGSVYDGLVSLNGGSARGLVGPALFKQALASAAAWHPVTGLMSSAGYDKLSVTERQAIYRMLAGLLLRHAAYLNRERSVPISPKMLASCCANITSLFDNAYPGYLRSGVALVIAKALIRRKS